MTKMAQQKNDRSASAKKNSLKALPLGVFFLSLRNTCASEA